MLTFLRIAGLSLGFVLSAAIGFWAGVMISERMNPEPTRILVSLNPGALRGGTAGAQPALLSDAAINMDAGIVSAGVKSACAKRFPKNKTRRSTCEQSEMEGLAFVGAFPDHWNFSADTNEQTTAAIAAGNAGAEMLDTCVRLHGAAKSADGFAHYQRMKVCLEAKEQAEKAADD